MSLEARPDPDAQVPPPPTRVFPVTVQNTERLSPSFIRITFNGESLQSFGAAGGDQKVRLLIPRCDGPLPQLPLDDTWHPHWRALPDAVRPHLRTYTVRSFNREHSQMDIDFVVHGHGDSGTGPACEWALAAKPCDPVYLIGPGAKGRGRAWGREWEPPQSTQIFVVAGDETAVPAIAAICAELPEEALGSVLIEVAHAQDEQRWPVPAGVKVSWLLRQGPVGEKLGEQVVSETGRLLAAASNTEGGIYVWMAAESGVVKRVRRELLGELKVPRDRVVVAGYWRYGRTLEG